MAFSMRRTGVIQGMLRPFAAGYSPNTTPPWP